ncbi:MAG TPA: hypothetical protein PK295_03390 [Candidatus Magasanikbacteria bacterium]|nr:hypothetical protein [Candidatus Magasanikbacteria bacterium]
MKIGTYLWRIVINIITLAVIIMIYSSIYDSDITIIISILIIIYLSIVSGVASLAWMHIEKSLIDYNRYKNITKMINKTSDEKTDFPSMSEVIDQTFNNPKEEEDQELKEAQEFIKNNKIKFYINMGFNSIFYIIAVVKLIDAL